MLVQIYLGVMLQRIRQQPFCCKTPAHIKVSSQYTRRVPSPATHQYTSDLGLETTDEQNGSTPSVETAPNVGRRPKQPHHNAGLVTLAQAE